MKGATYEYPQKKIRPCRQTLTLALVSEKDLGCNVPPFDLEMEHNMRMMLALLLSGFATVALAGSVSPVNLPEEKAAEFGTGTLKVKHPRSRGQDSGFCPASASKKETPPLTRARFEFSVFW